MNNPGSQKKGRGFPAGSSSRKYLLYAIGEILLVMIGIVLALQVNNWNQERTEKRRELDMVKVMYHELDNTQHYLTNRIDNLDKTVRITGKKIRSYFTPQQSVEAADSFYVLLMDIFYIGGFAPQTAKFQQVIGGSGMDLIRSDSLQLLLVQYQNQLNLSYKHDQEFSDHTKFEDYINRHLVVHTMMSKGSHGWYDLFWYDVPSPFNANLGKALSDPEFENIIVNRLALLYSANKRLRRVQGHVHRMMDFMERHYSL